MCYFSWLDFPAGTKYLTVIKNGSECTIRQHDLSFYRNILWSDAASELVPNLRFRTIRPEDVLLAFNFCDLGIFPVHGCFSRDRTTVTQDVYLPAAAQVYSMGSILVFH